MAEATRSDKRGKTIMAEENKCDSCKFEVPTCRPILITFGIDIDPTLKGAEADKVLKCSQYQKKGE